MSQLAALQHRLSAFRHRRQLMRWGMAGMALLIGMFTVLATWFLLDVTFVLSISQRIALIVLGTAAIFWATRRFVIPWLRVHETPTDVALFVQSQHGIDSDLVAALQFDQAASAGWGSRELQAAVVDRIADLSPRLDVAKGVDYGPFLRRARWLGAMLAVTIAISLMYPRYIAVFFARLLLSPRHYPSDTTIESIHINTAQTWEWNASHARPRDVRSAKNRPLTFLIHCTGELPESGELVMHSLRHSSARTVKLERVPAGSVGRPATSASNASTPGATYRAELPRLVEEFRYTVRLGDAWTDEAQIGMIEPPLVELDVRVEPPKYAASAETREQSPRHLAVLEGSRISIDLRCISSRGGNKSGQPTASKQESLQAADHQKRLKSATIKIDVAGAISSHGLVNPSADGLNWTVPSGTPLSSVMRELRYEIQVVDQDNMTLETPLQGFVQLKPDRPPSAVATVVHRMVLPNAKPVIEYRLNDDYGIESATLQGQIERQPAQTESSAEASPNNPQQPFSVPIPLSPLPRVGQNLPCRGQFPLDLAPFHLAKGDQLKLTLTVVDYRGDKPGRQELSEPILLEISDEAGVLAAITEADERSEKRLNDVITQQLGVGGSK